MRCKNCGYTERRVEIRGVHTGLFCAKCGTWLKWLSKSEVTRLERGLLDINSIEIPDKVGNNKSSGVVAQRGVGLIGSVTDCCGYELGYQYGDARFCPVCGKPIQYRR